jgi:hypothetical protein
MRKGLAILGGGVVIVAAILVAVYYQQRSAVGQGYDIKCTQSSVPTSASASLACEINSTQNAEHGHSKWHWLNVLIAWPEGVTAWLLLLTMLVIAWQSWATSISAMAANRSIKIQEAGMRQWVDVEAIDCRIQKWRLKTPRPFAVNIQLQVVNNTPNVLTLMKVETVISISLENTEVFCIEVTTDLSSHKESESSRYPFYVPTETIEEKQLSAGAIVILNGQVTFIDCLGETRTQDFGGVYSCSDGYIKKLSAIGITPRRVVKPGMYIPGIEEKRKG